MHHAICKLCNHASLHRIMFIDHDWNPWERKRPLSQASISTCRNLNRERRLLSQQSPVYVTIQICKLHNQKAYVRPENFSYI